MRRVVVVAFAVAACGGEVTDDAPAPDASWSSVYERPCPDGSVLTWESFGGPFLRNWCTGCHSADVAGAARYGAPAGVDFDTPAAARAWRERIWLRAGDGNATMPPADGVDLADRARLAEWLACGAP